MYIISFKKFIFFSYFRTTTANTVKLTLKVGKDML